MAFFTEDSYYTGPPLTDPMVKDAESRLGYRLPIAYVALLRERNGGKPVRRCVRTSTPTSWARSHFEIAALRGIGGEWGIDTLAGLGSSEMIQEWGYPNIGVVVCDMPSGGHDAVMLDYTACGPAGEPRVTYVDEDRVPRVIAASFAEFVEQLCDCAGLES